ncbi:hypothetical protein PVIIG_04315 [Plasmodium vivax India VII]|uniref:CCZ1/INTU/HSP4 first Longin domain-containing protein n=4 Tax=Plasmodium vivax TaxID=5855 RepID=A5K495_PLAVS|nr:hypothetical protein, conserved [Plasmodium vivax]EDL45473.1 hypothetical protein, conserved [Plasmodium vivax]KMZ80530.1 hypothetical protein PVIIG_04315 [Plasmodium vivax India VII]KMZ84163.1 hypothetical protein PVBG_02390 [Plasmodium vivax Brazil I]KMZ99765.1 hypothetical protein PVNG_04055 [Plasmodium vivax North Korean]|eukprot:XP_001615200.1 hypothetical protein [Plasmodium vivax Sal-1]
MEKTKIEALFIYDEDVKKADKSVTDEELQAEKVIYYYPAETDEQVKVTHTSTMEGVSAFLSQFSRSHMEHIITKENLIVINKWYKHVFVTIVVKNVYKNEKMELLMCKLLHSVLENFISTFTLLHGHIRTFLKYKKNKTAGETTSREGSTQNGFNVERLFGQSSSPPPCLFLCHLAMEGVTQIHLSSSVGLTIW